MAKRAVDSVDARKAPATAADLKPAPYNPRKIGDWNLEALGKSMERFGDLAGIVFNRRSGQLIGGHQRAKHLPPAAPISITERLKDPNEQGTVAIGYVEHAGERWVYREVDVDEQTEAAMNVAANKHGGEFDLPKLADVLSELDAHGFDDMGLTGFSEGELEALLTWTPMEDAGEGPLGGESGKEHECPKCGYAW